MAITLKGGYWARTRQLMWAALFLWFVLSFTIPLFAVPLNNLTFIGFPISYYFAAQGSVFGFIFLIFWHAARQDKIDREFGVSEDN